VCFSLMTSGYRLRMGRLPPALAASATPRVLELLGEPAGRVLELGFAGIDAARVVLVHADGTASMSE
jgi:hypothetical protein